jgi:hypothetical protein
MLQANHQSDPIVEILRLAYRRGLVIQREQEEKRQAVKPQSLELSNLDLKQELAETEIGTEEEQAKVSK